MTEPEGGAPRTEPDATRVGLTVLTALGIAVLLIVAAGALGVTMSLRDGTHQMMWGGPARDEVPAVQVGAATAGFSLDGMPMDMVAHYQHARANPAVYAQVSCYCGCQTMLGHRNLEECFVTPDGAWESHASGCQVCIDESQMVIRMMGAGMGPEMMRGRIDARYGGPMMGTSG